MPNKEHDPLSGLNCENATCEGILTRDDVISPANNDNRIVFASLYTYADEKDEAAFKKILLPPICTPTLDLYHMFYVNKRKTFSPYVLNTLVGAINKPALISEILEAYEEASGNNRASLTAQQKIMLRQEFAVERINSRVQKIANLNYSDFIDAVADEEMWFDEEEEVKDASNVVIHEASHKNLFSVDLHVYSDFLQMGFILIVQFVTYGTDSIDLPVPTPRGSVGYNSLNPTDDVALACNMCVTYTPTNE